MNVQLGIYEIFSTIIPGFVYLVALCQLLIMTGVVTISWKTIDGLSFISTIITLVLAYLVGLAFGHFGLVWYKMFKRKDQSVESLKAFKQRHQDRWNIDFSDEDWHVLLAFIRSKSLELARECERHLATSIMLRNVSFGFSLLALINIIQYFMSGNLVFLFICFGLLILSYLMIGETFRFRRWYYDSILSAMLAYRIDLEKSIKPVVPPSRDKEVKTPVVNG